MNHIKHLLTTLTSLFLTFSSLSAQSPSTTPSDLDSLLLRAYTADQTVRQQSLSLTRRINAGEVTPEAIDSLVWLSSETERIDSENIALVNSILKKGWPENLNEESYETIWLIIDHSSLKQQKKHLKTLEKAADNGDISYIDLATLKDRIAMHEGKPQLYGTQSQITVTADGKQTIYIWPVKDPSRLEQMRKEIGLSSIEEYVKDIEESTGIKTVYEPGMTVKEIKRLSKNQVVM